MPQQNPLLVACFALLLFAAAFLAPLVLGLQTGHPGAFSWLYALAISAAIGFGIGGAFHRRKRPRNHPLGFESCGLLVLGSGLAFFAGYAFAADAFPLPLTIVIGLISIALVLTAIEDGPAYGWTLWPYATLSSGKPSDTRLTG